MLYWSFSRDVLIVTFQTCELAVGCRGRRSSVTDYVELNHDAMILSTVSRARSARSLRSKRQMWSKSASVQQ